MAPKKTLAETGPGSPSSGEPVYLAVGFLRHPHGVRGEMLMEIHTDFPHRLKPGTQVFVGEAHRPMILAGQRPHSEGLIVSFGNLKTREEVADLRNHWVYVPAGNRPPLPEGQFYFHQLIGLSVVDENEVRLGRLNEILETGANNVYVVIRADGSELLIPAIPSVILAIDLNSHRMRVKLPPGLVEAAAG
jgi:16S rRNA processing protein RimM